MRHSNRTSSLCLLLMACLVAIVTACDNSLADDDSAKDNEESDVSVSVPITIAIGGYETSNNGHVGKGSPALIPPPGTGTGTGSGSADDNTSDDDGYSETTAINAVRIIAFRRKASSTGDASVAAAGDTTDFVYDASNDQTITTLTDEDGIKDEYVSGLAHKHRVAKGWFKKNYGFEYRIFAIAYDSNETSPYPQTTALAVIDHLTHINLTEGTTLSEFSATFDAIEVNGIKDSGTNWGSYLSGGYIHAWNDNHLSSKLITIPQIFYGYVYNEGDVNKNPIIAYSNSSSDTTADNSASTATPLRGILYRGMAEVQLTVTTDRVHTHNPSWICLMADNVATTVNLTSYDDFTSAYNPITPLSDNKYTAIGYSSTGIGQTTTIRTFLLPGKTHLAVRTAGLLNGGTTYHAYNGQIQTDDFSTGIDNATGVITPDAINNVFYLRRNHKYVFHCNKLTTIIGHDFD